MPILRFLLIAFLFLISTSAYGSISPDSRQSWVEFRELVPGHFQDWILVDLGSKKYTLIYVEPPTAYTLLEYGDVLENNFRGYVAHETVSRSLGYNGQVSDIVVELDYGHVSGDPVTALEHDLSRFSVEIYGTSYGARFLSFSELQHNPPSDSVPIELTISAYQLQKWLFGEDDHVTFISPENGLSADLDKLIKTRSTGRYLTDDNSLVALLVDISQELDFEHVSAVRKFTIDSDFILGGVVSADGNHIAVLGRARQLALADFPALRVEDVFNAMTAQDRNWAQSYDRSTPGAGPIKAVGGVDGDWAPSYLSSNLLDTEFGSLLNYADAVLKSQSLSDSVHYEGYLIRGFDNPPYSEGVFRRLADSIGLTSLVFNFNTVGVGHWLIDDLGHQIYALNSSGSFSVTYSPDTSGQDSTTKEAPVIDLAENLYTDWFRQQRDPILVRTVQYMGVYQLFGDLELKGARLYPDRVKAFEEIGTALRESVKGGVDACLDELPFEDNVKLQLVDGMRQEYAHYSGFRGEIPEMPQSLLELKNDVAKAATQIRYDANLLGDRFTALNKKFETIKKQAVTIYGRYHEPAEQLSSLDKKFYSNYGDYETGQTPIYEDGELIGKRIEYRVPDYLQQKFVADKAEIGRLADIVNPLGKYLEELSSKAVEIEKEINEVTASFGSNELLLNALGIVCSFKGENTYANTVLAEFLNRTRVGPIRGNELYALSTPTVVISNVDTAEGFVGGHNVEIQNFKVLVDSNLDKGEYRFNRGGLRVSKSDVSKIGPISRRFAQVVGADPETQRKAFSSALKLAPEVEESRVGALGLRNAHSNFNTGGPRFIEATNLSKPSFAKFTSESGETVLLGRDSRSNRLFLERAMSDGERYRTLVFGANMSSELIDSSIAKGQSVVKIALDPSLSAHDIEAIIANYKSARPLTSSGGGGWGAPPGKIASAASTPGDSPRMVVFTDKRSTRQRAIVETNRGRVELLLSRTADKAKILRKLETQIESGAILTLKPTKVHKNGIGTNLLTTGYQIKQTSSISGSLIARTRTRFDHLQGAIDRIRKVFSSSFETVRDDPQRGSRVVDYVIDVKRRISSEEPGWEVVGSIVVDDAGMRFVLHVVPSSNGMLAKLIH